MNADESQKEAVANIEKMLQDPNLNPHDREYLEYKLRVFNGDLDFSDLD